MSFASFLVPIIYAAELQHWANNEMRLRGKSDAKKY